MRYKITSLWAGRYGHTYHGITKSPLLAFWWITKWSVLEFFRVLSLNQYHYGNIFGCGDKQTDSLNRKLDK